MARKRKRRSPSKSRAKPKVRLVLWLLLLANVAAGIVWSPVTSVRRVRVIGAREHDRQRLTDIAATLRDIPCAAVNRPLLETRVLSEGDVRRAELSRNPFGRATLLVGYRRPVARLDAKPEILLSNEGVLYRSRRVVAGLPVLRLPLETLEPSATLAGLWEPGRVAELCARASEFGPVEKTVIDVESTGRLCLNMGSGARIEFGSSEKLDDKLDEVHRILRAHPTLLEEGFGVNVTAPSKPVVVPPTRAQKP